MKHYRMSMLLSLALVFGVAIGGCQSFNTDAKRIQATCASATSSIQIAALYKEKLTETQLLRTRQAIDVIQPVCGNPDVIPTLDNARRAVIQSAADQLFQIAMEVKK